MSAPLPTISLPVTCPRCGAQSLIDFPSLVVRVALTQWNQLALYASCHEGSWDASPAELETIRRHVGQAWIDDPQPLALTGTSTAPRARPGAPRTRAS